MKNYKGKVLLLVFLFFSCIKAFPSDISYIREFLFEIFRYSQTGVSAVSDVAKFKSLSLPSTGLLMIPVWNYKSAAPEYLIERFYPEKKGTIQSSFSYDDVYTFDGIDIVDKVLYLLNSGSDAYSDILQELDNRDDSGIADYLLQDAETPVEITETDKDGFLRRFSYGEEQVSISEINGLKYIVDSADSVVKRRFFDENMRLIKTERYDGSDKSSDFKLVSDVYYFYNDGDFYPFKSEENNVTEESVTTTLYSDAGNKIEQLVSFYEIPNTDSSSEEVEKELVPREKKLWSYDDDNRVLSYESIEITFSYDRRGNKISSEESDLTRFSYTGIGSEPDTDYYENGTLRVRKIFTDSYRYTETLFFDGGFKVVAEYESGRRLYETVYQNDTELRSRYFEN